MEVREKEVEELVGQARILSEEGQLVTDEKENDIEKRFLQLMAPLQKRRQNLLMSKMSYQFYRDLEDESVRSYI